jgi:uncharacterized protein involved in exopolysaccharide biosynthesis
MSAGKDGIIAIDVDDTDSERAAQIANTYVDELTKLTTVLAVTEASQRRLFFERQLAQARQNMQHAELTARQALQQGGLVKVDDQGRAMVETTTRLRAQIAVQEVRIAAMRAFAADNNPDLQRAQQELEAMKHEAARMEGAAGPAAPAAPAAAAGTSSGIDNLERLRDVKYYETGYELMAQQYELAKIDEARDASVVQVIDKAVAPDRKSKPARLMVVVVFTLIAGFVAVFAAFIMESMAKAATDPRRAERLARLRSHF